MNIKTKKTRNYGFGILLSAILVIGSLGSTEAQTLVAHWDFLGASPSTDLQGNFSDLVLFGGASIDGDGLNVTGTAGYGKANVYTGSTILNKTLVSWAVINDLTKRAGSILTIDRISGDVFDGIVYAEAQVQKWMAGSNLFQRTQALTHSDAFQSTSGTLEMLAITYEYVGGSDIRMKVYRNGVLIGNYVKPQRSSYLAGNTEVMFGARHTNPNPLGAIDATIKDARIYDGVLTQAQIQALTMGSEESCDDFTVNLKDSDGNLLAGGSLEYREGGPNGWQAAAEVADGVFCIDTERSRVGLRMTYSPQVLKVAKVPTNADYTFQMEEVTVYLENLDGVPVDGGEVDYSSGGWHTFGTGTTGDDGDGMVTMDMLPTVYSFRLEYFGEKDQIRTTISSSNNWVTFIQENLKSSLADSEDDFKLVTYPNPFSNNATIAFSLEEAQEINISVYDQTGRLIETLHNGYQTEGNHKISWDGNNVNKGVYFIRLSSNGKVVNKNIVKM